MKISNERQDVTLQTLLQNLLSYKEAAFKELYRSSACLLPSDSNCPCLYQWQIDEILSKYFIEVSLCLLAINNNPSGIDKIKPAERRN